MPDSQTIQYYDLNAEQYARASETGALRGALDLFASRLRPGSCVLDLGCGAGRDLAAFRKRGFLAVGLDASKGLSSIATSVSDCPVVVGDMVDLPFAEASFDGVWASASLLHLNREELPIVLGRLGRVLKPGGALFTSMKLGVGCDRDVHGRRFTYLALLEWYDALHEAGFINVLDLPDDTFEHGNSEWLRTLATNSGT